jgi:hypothetical protein
VTGFTLVRRRKGSLFYARREAVHGPLLPHSSPTAAEAFGGKADIERAVILVPISSIIGVNRDPLARIYRPKWLVGCG